MSEETPSRRNYRQDEGLQETLRMVISELSTQIHGLQTDVRTLAEKLHQHDEEEREAWRVRDEEWRTRDSEFAVMKNQLAEINPVIAAFSNIRASSKVTGVLVGIVLTVGSIAAAVLGIYELVNKFR